MDESFSIMRLVFGAAIRLMVSAGGVVIGWFRKWRAERRLKNYVPNTLGEGADVDLSEQTTAYTIRLPRSTQWDSSKAYQFTNHMLTTFGHLIFRIVAERNMIAWQIVDLQSYDPDIFKRAIRSFYPGCTITVSKLKERKFDEPFYRLVMPYQTMNFFPAPTAHISDLNKADPLTHLTQAMSELETGERIIYTLWVAGIDASANEAGFKLITHKVINPLEYASIGGAITEEIRHATNANVEPGYKTSLQNVMEEKLGNTLFTSFLLMQIDAPTDERLRALAATTIYPTHFAKMPFNALIFAEDAPMGDMIHILTPEREQETDTIGLIQDWLSEQNEAWKTCAMILEARELAALWHLPDETFTANDIVWMNTADVAAPRIFFTPHEGVMLGINTYGDGRREVFLPNSERTNHTTIIGKTGTGKSSLLHNLIGQDILAGRGVAVIDPAGDLVQDILRWSIPANRADDVVVLDISYQFNNSKAHISFPPPMNLLAKPEGVDADIAAGMMVAVLEKIYGDGFSTTQMGHTLTMGLLTLSAAEQPTLLDVERVYDDLMYRQELLANIDNLALTRFWERFDATSQAQREQFLYPVLRRLDAFYRNKLLLPITCHPDSLNIPKLISENKIILVSLRADETQVPAAERMVLGATIISQIQMAALAGAIRKEPYLLYIDEVHNFITTSLAKTFVEIRKRGLGLVVANQYFKQLTGETLDALMGTVGSLIAFECDDADAKLLAPYMKPEIDTSHLVKMGKFNAAVSVRSAEGQRAAFTIQTLEQPKSTVHERIREAKSKEHWLRKKSVENYTPKPYSVVKQWLDDRYKSKPTPQPTSGEDDEFIEPRWT
jgi:Type IV secretion-system coupling protein DNA-binding domain